jgi:hypothetical protein
MGRLPHVAVLVGALGLSACDSSLNDRRIIAKVASPDGQRDAVHVSEIGGGATVGPAEEVYIVERGTSLQLSDRIASLEMVCRLNVRWLSNDLVEISYFARRLQHDRSFWKPVTVNVRYVWLGRDASDGC